MYFSCHLGRCTLHMYSMLNGLIVVWALEENSYNLFFRSIICILIFILQVIT